VSALPEQLLHQVAECFRLLGEPARLRIINVLRQHRELTVTQLVELTGLSQANLSKHLQLLHAASFVSRRREGLHVWYAVADRDTIELCDRMRARLEAEAGHEASPP
jgi:DNA-binding transcriptional ArsR family regulator